MSVLPPSKTAVYIPAAGFGRVLQLIDSPKHPSCLELLAYWRDCEARGGLVAGIDVPSRKIARLLSGIAVFEPVGDWQDARVRLAGHGLSQVIGYVIDGMRLMDFNPDEPARSAWMLERQKTAVTQHVAVSVETSVATQTEELSGFETLLVPILAPDRHTHWCLTGTFRK